MKELMTREITALRDCLDDILANDALTSAIEAAAQAMIKALQSGGKIVLCGNGGSAADAQHLAAELVGRLSYDRPGMAAIALTTDSSALTAIGNDYGYAQVFARQIEALGQPGDVLIAISTSGNSANMLEAIKAAKARNIHTIGLTGESGGKMLELCDEMIRVPSKETPHIQECHIMIGHILCALAEEAIHGEAFNPNRKSA